MRSSLYMLGQEQAQKVLEADHANGPLVLVIVNYVNSMDIVFQEKLRDLGIL